MSLNDRNTAVVPVNWELVRNEDGSIDLCRAFALAYPQYATTYARRNYFAYITKLQPIKSRQLAAMILTTALNI